MFTHPIVGALTTSCQTRNTGNAILGGLILLALIGGIVGLGIANGRARNRLAAANAELSFLRPENLRLQQLVAGTTGAPLHDAYASSSATGPEVASRWHPDPSGRHEFRWWDGTKWTDQVSDKGTNSTDPIDR